MVGDNEIEGTATALEAGYRYLIWLNVSYHPNPRTPPAEGESPPEGYTQAFEFDSDGSDVTRTFTVPLPDCHWQIMACFTLYYWTGEYWGWNGDPRAAQCVDIWSDCVPGAEACSPGFFKKHLEAWVPTGYSPDDDFDTTFGVDLFDPDITLEQAVNAKGGGVKKLARHGTAALLSAAHPDVAYPLTVAEVIAAVQAGDADTLADYNEEFEDCPLD